jgi:hypothetical protein
MPAATDPREKKSCARCGHSWRGVPWVARCPRCRTVLFERADRRVTHGRYRKGDDSPPRATEGAL